MMGRDFSMPLEFEYEKIDFEGTQDDLLHQFITVVWGCKLNLQNVSSLLEIREDINEKALNLSLLKGIPKVQKG